MMSEYICIVEVLTPRIGIGDTLILLCSMGQDPTTVQVDYRVTHSLTNVLVLLLARNAPLR